MKTIANCSFEELIVQMNKIRKKVADYYKLCKIGDIRRIMPNLEGCNSSEEREERLKKQAVNNINLILDECLERHPKETIELVGLLCFMDYDEAKQMNALDLMDVISSVISDKRAINFLLQLAKLGNGSLENTSQK